MENKKMSYCQLDKKGMGFKFNGCVYPNRFCWKCGNWIPKGKEIKDIENVMEQKINKLAKEIAWTVGNAIVDSGDERLKSIDLGQLMIIRDIIERETKSVVSDMVEKNKEINEILDRI